MSTPVCENYGTQNGTSCACPPGFGGSTCSQTSCTGNIFQGVQRPLVQDSVNLTSSECACENGWNGTGCNVCTSASVCQGAIGSSTSAVASAQNSTLTCNTSPRVYSSGQLSCKVLVSQPCLPCRFRLVLNCQPRIPPCKRCIQNQRISTLCGR